MRASGCCRALAGASGQLNTERCLCSFAAANDTQDGSRYHWRGRRYLTQPSQLFPAHIPTASNTGNLDLLFACRAELLVLAFERGGLVSVTVFGGEPYTPTQDWGWSLCRSDPGDAALSASTGAWLWKGQS